MGNCQASEAATAVIQHPGGKAERLYWPTSAADVMKSNPGHYVALVTLTVSETKQDGGTVKFTRVRLLKPKDVLLLGRVYRLITSQAIGQKLRRRSCRESRTSSRNTRLNHAEDSCKKMNTGNLKLLERHSRRIQRTNLKWRGRTETSKRTAHKQRQQEAATGDLHCRASQKQ
ncbi:uncharacterized protein LOC122033612 isoform X1 [Zingiber officinale]|uniref:uncharacterized protein LOC122033612 isoform X1 n=1 Tax=Zingiber officinale TaxID=94328 RepID=UPI001C4C6BCF|nr:uncharacterized protein LOC122033612 isoform X1 [Zingiber officinale]